jgi:hypothetical protein
VDALQPDLRLGVQRKLADQRNEGHIWGRGCMTAGTQMCATTSMLSRIESSIDVQYRKARVHEWNGPCYQTWNNRKTNVKHFEIMYIILRYTSMIFWCLRRWCCCMSEERVHRSATWKTNLIV